jgi:hypothetical protein
LELPKLERLLAPAEQQKQLRQRQSPFDSADLHVLLLPFTDLGIGTRWGSGTHFPAALMGYRLRFPHTAQV